MENEIIKKESTVTPTEVQTEVKPTVSAENMVEQAFTEAVAVTVKNDENVQKEIMHNAEKVIHNKTSALKAEAEREAKEAHFNNKKSACECFGYNETTTERWAVSLMGIWHNFITAIWIIIGMFTFAPVTFVAKKLSVLIKTAWVAVLFAIIIYALIVCSPFLFRLITSVNGGAVTAA